MTENTLTPIKDLFGTTRYFRPDPVASKPISERAVLINYFHQHALDKNNKPFPVAYIGMKLSHLELRDLYFLKSTCESESRRGTEWGKVFWGSIKAK
jgi:hypothetical protein